jgi:hypothetical protein
MPHGLFWRSERARQPGAWRSPAPPSLPPHEVPGTATPLASRPAARTRLRPGHMPWASPLRPAASEPNRMTVRERPVARLRPLPLSQAWAGHRPSLQRAENGPNVITSAGRETGELSERSTTAVCGESQHSWLASCWGRVGGGSTWVSRVPPPRGQRRPDATAATRPRVGPKASLGRTFELEPERPGRPFRLAVSHARISAPRGGVGGADSEARTIPSSRLRRRRQACGESTTWQPARSFRRYLPMRSRGSSTARACSPRAHDFTLRRAASRTASLIDASSVRPLLPLPAEPDSEQH